MQLEVLAAVYSNLAISRANDKVLTSDIAHELNKAGHLWEIMLLSCLDQGLVFDYLRLWLWDGNNWGGNLGNDLDRLGLLEDR